MLKQIALGMLFFSLFLFSLIGSSSPNIITGLANLNDSVQCGTCDNWTDIACGTTEQDSFGCQAGEMYQTRTCNIVFNPTSSPTILKIKPLEIQPTGLAILSSENACTARCVVSDLCTINNPPSQPVPLTPEDKEVNIPINYELQWFSEDPENDELLYDIYFGDINGTDLIVSNFNDTTYDINNLELNKIYKWKIVAKDNISEVPSETWWFKTENFEEIKSSQTSGSNSFINPAAKENSELLIPKTNDTIKNSTKLEQESLVIKETSQDLVKKEVSSITGNTIKFVVSNNNVIFQSISIILIGLTIFFIKRKK